MAAKQSSPVVRVVATVFTSLVAPTLVALITTTIREAPRPDGMPNRLFVPRGADAGRPSDADARRHIAAAGAEANATSSPRTPLVWRPIAANDTATVSDIPVTRRD